MHGVDDDIDIVEINRFITSDIAANKSLSDDDDDHEATDDDDSDLDDWFGAHNLD